MNKIRKKERLWIITELFYPDETSTAYILTKIANKLSKKYNISVISGPSIYDREKKVSSNLKLSKSIEVLNKKSFLHDKNSLVKRALSAVLLSISLSYTFLKKVRKGDKVFITTNPPLLMVILSLLRKIKQYELNILVHDIFPENTLPVNILNSKSLFYKTFKFIFDTAYSRASLLIVIGSDMKEIIIKKISSKKNMPKIELVTNWADLETVYPLPNENGGKIRFLFAGNMGKLQGLDKVISMISSTNNSSLEFIFAGTGAMRGHLKTEADRMSLKNIKFQNSFPRSEQISILNNCEICLVTLVDEMYGLGVPSKTYNIMAAGKPILFIGNKYSEIAELIDRHQIGYIFSFEEQNLVIDFLNNLSIDHIEELAKKGEKARKIAEDYFSEDIILNKYYNLL